MEGELGLSVRGLVRVVERFPVAVGILDWQY